MPVKQSKLTSRDPVGLNKEQCEQIITAYLTQHGFQIISTGIRNEPDIVAYKAGWKVAIEVRGNQAVNHDTDTVFDTAQLNVHFAEQIYDVMRAYRDKSQTIHVIANPDIPRIRNIESKVSMALNEYRVARFWLSHKNVDITIPSNVKTIAHQLFTIEKSEITK
jgi:Holliday junction resolvase-like predicted endonuclease